MTVLIGLLSGGVGAGARYWLSGAVQRRLRGRFPIGTMVVNLTGCAAVGFAAGVTAPGSITRLAITGLAAGFTTFSTWSLENLNLIRTGNRRGAAVNMVLLLAAGLGLCAMGYHLAN